MKFFIFFIFFPLIIFSQTEKKEILYDLDNSIISKETFLKKIKKNDTSCSIFESDSVNKIKLVKLQKPQTEIFEHYFIGKISDNDNEILINEILNLTNSKIDNKDFIIINFFKDESVLNLNQKLLIEHYTSIKSYYKYFNKHEDLNQFFITQKNYSFNSKLVFNDTNGIIENICFKDSEFFSDYIIIFPNQHYILKRGEYRIEMIKKFIDDYKEGKLEILFN